MNDAPPARAVNTHDDPPGVVLVTGASGVVGGRLVTHLQDSGATVRATARSEADTHELAGRGVEVVRGDLRDDGVVRRACDGCARVIHCAAATGRRLADRRTFWAVNGDTPAELWRAAARAGVRRMVQVSTTGVHGPLRRWPIDADGPLKPDSIYRRSKLRGEQRLTDASSQTTGGPEVVIARITSVSGPGTASTWRSLYESVARDGVTLVGSGEQPVHLVDIDDVCAGLARCLTRPGVGGQTLMLGAREPIRLIDLMAAVAEIAGVPLRVRRRLPGWPAAPIGRLALRALSCLGPEPASLHSLAFLTSRRAYRTERSWALLDHRPRFDAKHSMQRTFAEHNPITPTRTGTDAARPAAARDAQGAIA